MSVNFWRIILSANLFISSAFAESYTQANNELFKGGTKLNVRYWDLQQQFWKKCASSNQNLRTTICGLLETDIDPEGRPDRILLFRGEFGDYKQPMTSSFYRWAVGPEGFCEPTCTNQQLAERAISDLEQIVPMLSWETSFDRYIYEIKNKTWKSSSRSSKSSEISAKPMGLISALNFNHLAGSQYFKFENISLGGYDPLISFSLNPQVAHRFRYQVGKMFVASVPLSQVKLVSKEECKTERPEIGFFYALSNCFPGNTYHPELEVDGYIFVPEEYYYGQVGQ